jgi:Zn-dependent membrane protease YugP
MFFWDPTYLMVLPALLLAFWAQSRVSKNYKKYKQVANRRGMTGVATARWILDQNNLQNVSIEMSKGRLSDHYDPRSKTVRLSPDNYNGASLAAVAIAAHECGHAIQDAREYTPLRLRTAILPVANIGSWAAFPLFIAGFIFQWTGLIQLGIAFFCHGGPLSGDNITRRV